MTLIRTPRPGGARRRSTGGADQDPERRNRDTDQGLGAGAEKGEGDQGLALRREDTKIETGEIGGDPGLETEDQDQACRSSSHYELPPCARAIAEVDC